MCRLTDCECMSVNDDGCRHLFVGGRREIHRSRRGESIQGEEMGHENKCDTREILVSSVPFNTDVDFSNVKSKMFLYEMYISARSG